VLRHRGHKYLTVVYQIDGHCRRLLWTGVDRTTECLDKFFDEFGPRARHLRFVCRDMWRPYINILARRAKQAVHVLDRCHLHKCLSGHIWERSRKRLYFLHRWRS